MEQIMDVFSQNLKRIRKEKEWTQEELSEKCHYDRTYIGKIERGQKYPSLDVIPRLSRVLEVSIVDLFMGPKDLPQIKYVEPRKDRLELNESVYQSIFSTRYHFMVLFDGEGTVVKVNNDVIEFLDQDRESIEGSKFWEWTPWEKADADRLEQDMFKIREGIMIREQILVPLPDDDGSYTLLDFVLTPRSESREDTEYHVMEGLIDGTENGVQNSSPD